VDLATGTPDARVDATAFALDGLVPADAFAPRSVDALATLVRTANDDGRAVVPFGGGTLQGLGALPRRYDVAVSLGRLDRVVAYEFQDLTIAVEAGCTLARLQATLAAHGQFVPLDAPHPDRATVGGTLAAGWLGPRRSAYARPRDLVIGTTVVLADGTVARAGGMVVKNSTGYDLSKLYVGSLGTLGVLVRANLKTLPLPAARRVAVAALPERSRAHATANVAALGIEPTAAVAVEGFANEIDGRDGIDGRLFLLYEGSGALVDRATRELRSALGAAGVPETRLIDGGADAAFARLVDAYVAPLGSRSATYRSGGDPADAHARRAAFARLARAHELACETIEDLRSGDLFVRMSSPMTADFAERVAAFDAERATAAGGALATARVVAAPNGVRARLDAWGAPPPALDAMRALKSHFDPHGTLAPGRFVGGL
jgi:glycolate oxidase FAD binding subunit